MTLKGSSLIAMWFGLGSCKKAKKRNSLICLLKLQKVLNTSVMTVKIKMVNIRLLEKSVKILRQSSLERSKSTDRSRSLNLRGPLIRTKTRLKANGNKRKEKAILSFLLIQSKKSS